MPRLLGEGQAVADSRTLNPVAYAPALGDEGASRRAAQTALKERLTSRPGYGSGGLLSVASPFGDLCELWLADLELRDISEGTKQNYVDLLRLHVRLAFEQFTLGEITTGRVEWFLKRQGSVSWSQAKHTRTLLNQLFAFALRHHAIARNPVEGTSPLARPKREIRVLTLEQVQALRAAATAWRTGPDVKGPKPEGKVRDICEVLLAGLWLGLSSWVLRLMATAAIESPRVAGTQSGRRVKAARYSGT